MTIVTPGVDFLATGFFFLSLPVFTASILGKLHKILGGTPIPTWILGLAGVASVPIIATLRIIGIRMKHKREAAAMGAKMIPSPRGKWPGNADLLKSMLHNFLHGYPADDLVELLEEHGPAVNLRIFWSDLIFTASPEHIKITLATDFDNYVKGSRFQRAMSDVLGVGVFNSDGDLWKFHRSITRPAFTRDRISDFELFDRHAEIAIQQLKSRLREGHPVDFQDLMSRFTLDSATEFLFGHCVHNLKANLPYPHNAAYVPNTVQTPETRLSNEFSNAFLEAQFAISQRERYGWVWPLYELFGDKTKEHMKVVNAFIEPIVADAIAKKDNATHQGKEKDPNSEDGTLLDHLVQVTSDPKILKDETLNIMLAGRDTTAATLTFTVYLLSQHPDVMKRLRQEILDKVGPTRRPTFDDIREMRYLRAVINETLRLYPAVPIDIRETVNATTWPNPDPNDKPFHLPAGTKVAYSVFVMHRRKDLWGPDAEEFDPDRFLDERLKKYLISNSFIFLPFNAGPRICLGQQFAYNEMSFMLVRLLQNFSSISLELDSFSPGMLPPEEFKLAPGRKGIDKVWPKMTLTMYVNGGLWVKMQEANNA
ncbi:cytochrome P450 [Macrolepiota fuliginosa MF-IS2]|uniref:Cytochrome P450 n=1 Tax=Macrolepiota fuliginosa MF-IS2 TaxID=1400762 RepID=A0A9P5XI55_9AGAR|nr:cytochrome P450 [Macrolepiota fuliginosa MF-IS2]